MTRHANALSNDFANEHYHMHISFFMDAVGISRAGWQCNKEAAI